MTDRAFEHQLSDASLSANSAHERVREVCSNTNIKIVVGETGCGKSTQIPQLICEFTQTRQLIWLSTPLVKACVSLQKRLRTITADCEGTNCVSVYQGAYENQIAEIGQEIVATHTLRTRHCFDSAIFASSACAARRSGCPLLISSSTRQTIVDKVLC